MTFRPVFHQRAKETCKVRPGELASSLRQIAVVRLADIRAAAPSPCRADPESASGPQVSAICQKLTEGCLNNSGEWGRGHLRADEAIHRFDQVIGNGYGGAFHAGDYSTDW